MFGAKNLLRFLIDVASYAIFTFQHANVILLRAFTCQGISSSVRPYLEPVAHASVA